MINRVSLAGLMLLSLGLQYVQLLMNIKFTKVPKIIQLDASLFSCVGPSQVSCLALAWANADAKDMLVDSPGPSSLV